MQMSQRIILIAGTGLLAVLATMMPAVAGSLGGLVTNPLGAPFSEVGINACQTGSLGDCAVGWSWASDPVGTFLLENLDPGTYSVGFNEKDEWNRSFKWGVNVTTSYTSFTHKLDYLDYGTGKMWDGQQRDMWAQSFMATGTSIISASIDCALEFGPDTIVSVHHNDPWGAQIGPSKTITTNINNPSAAYWSAGEVPTVPGNIYCVKFRPASTSPRVMPFIWMVKVQNGNPYPDGKTWRDGNLFNYPMKVVIGQDDDGIITTVSTQKLKPLLSWSANSYGQTFVANGSSVLCVSMLAGNTGGMLKVSIHDGIGSGQGGPQAGHAKYVKVDDWNHRAMAVWAPGEVPVENGKTYFAKIVRPDGQWFNLYHPNADEYAHGTAYKGGSSMNGLDLSTTIALEAYPGSTSVSKVVISQVNVLRRADSATISWTTPNVQTTESYVDYGQNTPYTNRKYDKNPTAHSVTLTGLQPNTLYHFRIAAKAAGRRDARTRDMVFVTEPLTNNLLANPGFETGSFSPWVAFSSNMIYTPTNQYFNGCRAHGGSYFVGDASTGGQIKGGCYQRVAVTPGRRVNLRSWLWTYQEDQIGALVTYTACGQIGLDPTGGTNPDSGNVVWTDRVAAQSLYTNGNGAWTEVWNSVVPTSNYVTVFLRAGSEMAMRKTVYGHDDVVLTQEPAATPLAKLSDIDAIADNARVSITDMVVTATKAQVGAVYLESPDRSRGIRVESIDNFTIGNKVTVTGYMGTKLSGERYIWGATKSSDIASNPVESMAAAASSVGAVAPSNVGLLMRVAGKVKSAGTGFVILNDGSMPPGGGLKIITSSLTTPPAVDRYIAVTGVVQLEEGAMAPPTPVLWPRSQADLQVLN